MKYIFADSLDMIDPNFDFIEDRNAPEREAYWGDQYPHEYFEQLPYDGVLISRGIVGDDLFPGKYTASMMMRFRRIGARAFLRMMDPKYDRMDIFGDCGAFSYVKLEAPPYTPEMMLEFYSDGGFTHGCSVDHIIFDFEPTSKNLEGGTTDAKRRFEITLENADAFLKASGQLGSNFTPLGVVQGWSPASMAEAALRLEKMGYTYLAVGGMVPLTAAQIHLCLQAIRSKISPNIKLHLLGFAKADQIDQFTKYGIASFDSTSPLTRAFKDAKSNYYFPNSEGKLDYYTAIRVPQATENPRLMRKAKSSGANQERLLKMEQVALSSLRKFNAGKINLEQCLSPVLDYNQELIIDEKKSAAANEQAIQKTKLALIRTLEAQPWKKCNCRVCREAGIDVMIFRGSNRNKRRGFHNLATYYEHLKQWIH